MRKQHQIKTEIQRNRLKPRTAIYWNIVSPGHAIGVRKYTVGFAWCARNGSVHTFKDSNHLSYDEALAMIISFWKKEIAIAASYTVEAAIADYAAHQRLHKGLKAEVSADRNCTRALRPFLSRELSSITKVELTKLHASWVRGGSPDKTRASKASANRLLASCKACFNIALKADKVTVNFWSGVEAFKKVDGARSLFLTKEQVQSLLDNSSGAIHDLIQGCVLTGMRMGEARTARVSDVDLNNNTIRLDGKTGERDVQMSRAVRQHVETLINGKAPDAPVWAGEDGREWKSGGHSRPFHNAARAAGLPKETVLYSTRHYHISQCLKANLPILAVAKACGTSVQMIQDTYGKFQPDTMVELMDTVSL